MSLKMHTLALGSLEENCYLLETDSGGCVIVDPGDEGSVIIKKLESLGLEPKAILVTHGHGDHIGSVAEILDAYPETKIYIGKNELEVVEHFRKMLGDKRSADTIKTSAIKVADGENIKIDNLNFKVMATPGHSKGGVVYIVGDSLFSGDTIFYHEIGRCDLYTSDYDAMFVTLRKIAALETNYWVYPGHGESTTIEEELKHNKYIKMALAQ